MRWSMTTLIIALPLQSGDASLRYEHVLIAPGKDAPEQRSVLPSQLPRTTRAVDETVVLVPVEALAWQRVELPKGVGPASPRLRAVLGGLLEERLLDDISDLHLAVQPHANAAAPIWVACCNRAWLTSHLRNLEAAGQTVTRIVPEMAPRSDAVVLQFLGEPRPPQLTVTGPDVPGGVIRLPLSAESISLALVKTDEAWPVRYLAEPSVAGLAESIVGHSVDLQQSGQRWAVAAATDWNLAQFDLASSGQTRLLRKLAAGARSFLQAPAWRPARWGLGLLLLANLAGLNAWAWREQSTLQQRRAAVSATLTQTFPQVKVVVDAPVQMARELAALRQAAGVPSSRDLEVMLGALAKAAGPDQTVTSIEFAGGEAKLKGLSVSADEWPALVATLQGKGYSLRQEGSLVVMKTEPAQ